VLTSILPRGLGKENWQRLVSLDYNARLYLCNLAGGVPNYAFTHQVYRSIGGWKLGAGSSIHRGLRLFCLGGVKVGRGTIINGECWIDGRCGVEIGSSVSISIGSRLLTLGHETNSSNFSPQGAPIIIEDYAWVGAFATIIPGVRLGKGSVVGAGAVVTKDVPEFTVVAGNPARKIGERNRQLDYALCHQPWFF